MAEESLKLGFIGGGLSSAIGQTHFGACRLDGFWQLESGLFSRDVRVNALTGETWHVDEKRVYQYLDDFLDHEADRLDAVVLLTPTPDHFPVLEELLVRQIPIICEKALVSSYEDALKLSSIYDARNNFLAVTYNYTGYPMVRELQEKIQKGALGKIHQIHLEMPQEGFIRPPDIAGKSLPPQSWRLKDDTIPTICLDLGVHLHHFVVFLLGKEPTEVMAEFNNYSEYQGLIDNVKMWLRFDDGQTGSFWMSKTTIGSRNGLKVRVMGDKASAEWVQINPEELSFSSIDGVHTKIDRGTRAGISSSARYNRMKVGHPSGFIEAFANLYEDMASALLQWKQSGEYSNPFVYGLDHAVNGLKLFHCARISDQTGQWVDLNEQIK